MKSNLSATIFRYIVLFIVVGLLAPYAGCHIFTSPPGSDQSLDTNDPTIERRRVAQDRSESSETHQDAGSERPNSQLNDIQELLSE